MEEVRRSMSGRKSNQLGAGACKNAELGNPAQKLLRLGYRLAGANLDFGEAPEEEPQGPKLVNKRLSSGCARFVGVTFQHHTKTNDGQHTRSSGRKQRHLGYALRTAYVSGGVHHP